jgi:hypothetical protein
VLAPVHDADHDRSRIGSYLDEIEASLRGDAPGFVERDDSDLFSLDADQTNWAETDLLIDSDSVVDSTPPCCGGASLPRVVSYTATPGTQDPEVSTRG